MNTNQPGEGGMIHETGISTEHELLIAPEAKPANTIKRFIRDGIIDSNPILVQVLGLCPVLAVTTTLANGAGMGISVIFILVFSNALISLLARFIPPQIRIAAYVVIIAGFVSALEMLLAAYLPALDRSLGLFIPLIAVNCIILARAEMYASKNKVTDSILDGLFMGLGYLAALLALSSVRELFGAGTLLGYQILPETMPPAMMLALPPGAFISLGCLIALFNKIAFKDKNTASKAQRNKFI
jgi:electron transport complex protein RnfE